MTKTSIEFTQDQLNEMYLFVQTKLLRRAKAHRRGSYRHTAENVTKRAIIEQDLWALVMENRGHIENMFDELTPIISGESIIFLHEDEDEDDDEFENLPNDPTRIVTSALLLLFLSSYGIRSTVVENERVAALRASAVAKLSPEELEVLGITE